MPLSYVCPSTSTSEDESPVIDRSLSATELLAVAIKKRRTLAGQKERDLRLELLHTGMIQSLCKHLGEGRARRRKRGKKRSNKSWESTPELPPTPSEVPVQALDDQEPSPKRCRLDEEDPFGLNDLFMSVYGRVPSGSSRSWCSVPMQSPAVTLITAT